MLRTGTTLLALFVLAFGSALAVADPAYPYGTSYEKVRDWVQAHPEDAWKFHEPVLVADRSAVASNAVIVTIVCNGGVRAEPDWEFLFSVQPIAHPCTSTTFDAEANLLPYAWVPAFWFQIYGCDPNELAVYIAGQLNSQRPVGFLASVGPNANQITISWDQPIHLGVSSGQDMSGPYTWPSLALLPGCPVNNLIDGTRNNERSVRVGGYHFEVAAPATPTPTITLSPTPTRTPTVSPTVTPTHTPFWLMMCQCATTPEPLDSDADRLNDLSERANGLGYLGRPNVCLADSDGDGLADGDEDKNGDNRVGAGESDPLSWDSDGDLFGDALEVQLLGTDPRSAAVPGDDPTDTDNDRLPDVYDPCPLKTDCDNDKISDGFEVLHCGLGSESSQATKPPLGDVDCFAGPTNLDALILQSVFLGLFGCTDVAAASWGDVNRDAELTNLDALIIQQFFFGNVPTLPVQ